MWIFMKDQELGYLFDAKNDPIPENVAFEDNYEKNDDKD